MTWWVFMFALFLMAGVALFAASRQSRASRIRRDLFASADGGLEDDGTEFGLRRTKQLWLRLSSQVERNEVEMLLALAGWATRGRQAAFYLVSLVLPPSLGMTAFGAAKIHGFGHNALAAGIFFLALGYLLPRYVLRYRAAGRKKRMQREVPQFALILRMLLDSGISLEHSLTIIVAQTREALPLLAVELGMIVRRLKAGQDIGLAVSDFNRLFGIDELRDIFSMLRQASEQGGNIRDSLAQYVDDMEARSLATLREYVSKLSAKMSIVMMLFLFPALLIFIGGPGILAVTRGLLSIHG